jgi:anti-sigma regulatory factor (Ser/Thr protein kinase)
VISRNESPRQFTLRIESHPANLAGVRRQIEVFGQICGFDETSRGQIVLCVNEALANVMRHAYGGATDRPIAIDAEEADGGMRIRIRDWGSGTDPGKLPFRRHDPLTPGGLGLICLRELMDEIVFTPQADGMLLTMTRQRGRRGGQVRRVG